MDGRPENRQKSVTEKFVNRAALAANGPRHAPKEPIEPAHHLAGAACGAEAGEIADIAKENGNLARFALQGHTPFQNCARNLRAQINSEQIANALALTEPVDHFVDALGDGAEFVGGEEIDPAGEISFFNLLQARQKHARLLVYVRGENDQQDQVEDDYAGNNLDQIGTHPRRRGA